LHPFAPVLAQLDADIATLEATRHGALARTGEAFEQSRSDVQAQLRNASARARAMNVTPPHAQDAPARLQETPPSETVATYTAALNARVDRAAALREAEFREKEATVVYDFERAHAGARLRTSLNISSPYLDARTRQSLEAQLKALNRQERSILQAQEAADASALAHFRDTLASESAAQLASMRRDVQAHAAALRGIAQPSKMLVARAEMIPSRTNVDATAAAFSQAAGDLHIRFTQLRDWNVRAASSTQQELFGLRAERSRLLYEMRSQIEAEAHVIAQQHGLGKVYATAPPPGATDLTRDVARALRAMRARG
jgi:hypothetical protein